MHRFFLDRDSKLETQEGRMELLHDLLTIEEELTVAGKRLGGMRVALISALSNEKQDKDDKSEVVFTMTVNIPEKLT